MKQLTSKNGAIQEQVTKNTSELPIFNQYLTYNSLIRYITVEITLEEKDNKQLVLKPSALYHAVLKSVERMYGDFGAASIKAGLNGKQEKLF